ncbi:major facilitator superfamily domain-containing protein [Chiua virens]|nr:major facilitator superfamily domain-containing protein [Chiua virens]
MTKSDASIHSPSSHDANDLKEFKQVTVESLEVDDSAKRLEGIVWKKLDRWILPVCTCFILLSAADKGNISCARIVGLQQSLHLSNYQYTVALTMTNVAFIVSGTLVPLILKHIGPHIVLPTMAVLWGLAATAQGFVKGFSGLLACRFLLGLFEGGLIPGLVLYLSFFYPRRILQKRVTGFYMTGNFFGAFGGLLAAGINLMSGKGGKPGWAWIFILEGVFTICFGVFSFFILPGSPQRARFLTDQEREYVTSTLKRVGSVSEEDDRDYFSWNAVFGTAKSLHVWLFAIIAFLAGAAMTGMVYFEPSLVASLGYSGNVALVMSAPPYATTTVFSFIAAVISDHYQCRGYSLMFLSLMGVIGWSMFYASHSNHVRYASIFFSAAGAQGGLPAMLTWLANNFAPHTRRATALAVNNVSTQLGSILGTWLLGYISPAPDYTTATITLLSMSAALLVLSMINLLYLWRENRMKEERKLMMKKGEEADELGDRSAWFRYTL